MILLGRHLGNLQLSSVPVLLLATICAGCVSYGGSSPSGAGAAAPEVQLLAPRLVISDINQQGQQGPDFRVTLAVRNSLPQLYYRYRVESAVNGNYFMMPSPPMIYRVYRVPFYKVDTQNVTVKFSITNTSESVLRVGKTVCAFDVNGKTVVSTPLQGTDVLPGHTNVFTVQGPDIERFSQIPPQGILTLWLYGLGEPERAYRWDTNYQYSETKSAEQAQLIATTPNEAMAKSYEGREDPAHSVQPSQQ